MATDENEVSLESLIGERLTGVVFVMDYIQLQFDGQVLSVLTPVKVSFDDEVYVLGMEGFRDKLCERIASTVTKTEINKDTNIQIYFEDDSLFEFPLTEEGETSGAEAIIFHGPGNYWWVLHYI